MKKIEARYKITQYSHEKNVVKYKTEFKVNEKKWLLKQEMHEDGEYIVQVAHLCQMDLWKADTAKIELHQDNPA